jgi:hypothetical protein
MQSIVGLFGSRVAAEQAVRGLLAKGFSPKSITLLSGESGKTEVELLPTTDAEADGMGEAMGAVVGGAMGAGAGLSLGTAVASLLVPGVGTIFAIGVGAAALLGLGGAAAGAGLGESSEMQADTGIPRDDVILYRQLLKRGSSLVIASGDIEDQAVAARAVFEQHGSEDIDSVRKTLQNAA